MRFSALIPALCALSASFAVAQGGNMPVRQKVFRSGPVAVYYDTTGPEAPFLTADADGNGHPDLVDSIAIYAGQFWNEYVTGLKLPAPSYDPAWYPAYPILLEHLPRVGTTEFGYNSVDGAYPFSYTGIENDFRYAPADTPVTYQPNGSITQYEKITLYRNPYAILKGVVYHELMHGIQRNLVTNTQLDRLWGERVATWCENRALYPRGRIQHANPFAFSIDTNCFVDKSATGRYGSGRLLTLLELMAGPSAVMEVYSARARWADSAGAAAVDDPVQELRFYQAILARHGITWKAFLLRWSEEIAHMFTYSGNGQPAPAGGGFPIEKAYFNVGNNNGSELPKTLPFALDLGSLRFQKITLASVYLKPGTDVDVRCPQGACHITAFHSGADWVNRFDPPVLVDAAHPLQLTLPPIGYIDLNIFAGEDPARIEITKGTVALAASPGPVRPRSLWTAGGISVQGLEAGKRARLEAWKMDGRRVLAAEVGSADRMLQRPMGEGPLRVRLTLLN
jgi:hypothetical protein